MIESVRIYGHVGRCLSCLSGRRLLNHCQTASCEWKPHVTRLTSSKETTRPPLYGGANAFCGRCSRRTKQHVHTSDNCLIKGNLLPWILPFHWRVQNSEGTGDGNDDHSPTVRCLETYWALIFCMCSKTGSECVFLHSCRRRIMSAWATSCSLTPEGPAFISTAPITQKGNETTSNYRGKNASKPKGVTFTEKWYISFTFNLSGG